MGMASELTYECPNCRRLMALCEKPFATSSAKAQEMVASAQQRGLTRVNEALGCSSYFAHAYHSWERGLNENTNGLIRQYFPKKMDLRDVSRDEIAFVEERLANRPRKTLDFMTPSEVTSQML